VDDPREQLVREILQRWNAGERKVDPALATPDVVLHSAMTSTDYRGEAEIMRWMAEVDEQFDDWNLTLDDLRSVEDGRLIGLGQVHFRGRASEVEFDQPIGWMFRFEDTRLCELWTFSSHEAALQAAGIASS
jgi:ketosteroid isomerase-like protein